MFDTSSLSESCHCSGAAVRACMLCKGTRMPLPNFFSFFSHFVSARTLAHGWCHSHQSGSSCSVASLWECPHKHQRCAPPFWELLSAVPSTVKVNSTLAALETSLGGAAHLGTWGRRATEEGRCLCAHHAVT